MARKRGILGARKTRVREQEATSESTEGAASDVPSRVSMDTLSQEVASRLTGKEISEAVRADVKLLEKFRFSTS